MNKASSPQVHEIVGWAEVRSPIIIGLRVLKMLGFASSPQPTRARFPLKARANDKPFKCRPRMILSGEVVHGHTVYGSNDGIHVSMVSTL